MKKPFNLTLARPSQKYLAVVGYQKITEDKASDANLPDAEIAFQPQRGPPVPMSDAEVARRRPRVLCQTRRSPDADLAFQCQTRTSRPLSMRTSANSAFQLKHKSEQLRVPTQTRACELRVSTSK